MTLEELNGLPAEAAHVALERCCGCRTWVDLMVAHRPFASAISLLEVAEHLWSKLTPDDWREAFAHHPKIGDLDSLRVRFADTADLAVREQGEVARAARAALEALAAGNRAYEEKFGYIFIVFASGRTAEEMLRILHQRLGNDPETEIRMAAGEQLKIMRLRLERMLAGPG